MTKKKSTSRPPSLEGAIKSAQRAIRYLAAAGVPCGMALDDEQAIHDYVSNLGDSEELSEAEDRLRRAREHMNDVVQSLEYASYEIEQAMALVGVEV